MSDLSSITFFKDAQLQKIMRAFDKKLFGKSTPAGIVLIVDSKQRLIGTISDGDIRRALLKYKSLDLKAEDVMQKSPISVLDGIPLKDMPQIIQLELKKRGRKERKFLGKIILVNKQNKPLRIIDYHQLWEQRVASHRQIAVYGLGYVGLTLALILAEKGYIVTGIDTDNAKITSLNNGRSYVHEIGINDLLRNHIDNNFFASDSISQEADVHIISVGTPLKKSLGSKPKEPDLSSIKSASSVVAKNLKQGNLVILRSTVPLGTCRNIVIPILEKLSKLKCGVDFYLSFAPERTAEGKALEELRTLPQIIGGFDGDSIEFTSALFREVTPMLVRVNSLEEAELAKLLNNCFRDYIFSFSNEVSKIAEKLNINIHNTIYAANRGYPRDKIPLPSPGVGGPCLTKDPYIFSHSVSTLGLSDNLFLHSRKINEGMHEHIVQRVKRELKKSKKNISSSKIFICGLAFKGYPETGDLRHSSAIEIYNLLKKYTRNIYGFDPIASKKDIQEAGIKYASLKEGFLSSDIVMFLNNHESFKKIKIFNFIKTMNSDPIIFDAWNQFGIDEIITLKNLKYMNLSFTSQK